MPPVVFVVTSVVSPIVLLVIVVSVGMGSSPSSFEHAVTISKAPNKMVIIVLKVIDLKMIFLFI